MWVQKDITIYNKIRGFHLITDDIVKSLPEIKNFNIGVLQLFIRHTSASLTINENTEASVRNDFEYHFNKKGEFHGIVKEWYKSGQIFRDFNYFAGKELGRQRMWKYDGTIKANYEVVNRDRFGLIGLKKCYTVTVNKDEIE